MNSEKTKNKWDLKTVCALAKEKVKYKYINLTVEAEEDFEISFFGWGSPPEFNYEHSL